MFRELVTMAFDSLRANKFRSLLTMLGIIIGSATLVAVLSLGNALQGQVFQQFIDLGTRRVALTPGDPQANGARDVPGYGLLASRDYETLGRLVAERPDLYRSIAPQLLVPTEVRVGSTAVRTTLVGTTVTFAEIQSAPAAYGRFLSEADERDAARVAVLGGALAEDLFGADPETLEAAIGRTVEVGGQVVTVVGILPNGGTIFGTEQQILAPVSAVRLRLVGNLDLPGRGTRLDQILVGLQSEQDVDQSEELIRSTLRAARGVPDGAIDDFELEGPGQSLDVLAGINSAVTAFIALVAGISLLVGGIGIMNIMLVAVTERTREIGVRKALGATDSDVLSQFVLEAVAISIAGSLIGVGGAIGLVLLVGVAAGLAVAISWAAVGLALVFACVVGVGFGYYPARRAALLLPIEALRYE